MQNKALEDVRAQVAQYLIIDEDEMHRRTMAVAEEAHLKNLREMEERLRAFGGL